MSEKIKSLFSTSFAEKVRKNYISPTIVTTIIEMEHSIATSSAQMIPGSNNATPEVEDWVKKEDEKYWDF